MSAEVKQRLKIRLNQIRYRTKTNSPFLSGDVFRDLSDLSIESSKDLEGKFLGHFKGGLIFCKSELLEDLVSALPAPQRDSILIAGNSDRNFVQELGSLLSGFKGVYLQNSLISDNKTIFTLPIGVENLRYGLHGLPKNLRSWTPWKLRTESVLVGPFSLTHESRSQLVSNSSFRSPNFTVLESLISANSYAEIVNIHKFVLCPRGNGIDTHRFWETLYRGAIPVVLKDTWSESLRLHDIPFVQVPDFFPETIEACVSEATLAQNFDNFEPTTTKSLWINYWESRLRK